MCEREPVITVYTSPNCGQCSLTQKYLTREGTTYDTVDFSTNPDALMAAKNLGYMSAPVVFARYPSGTEQHWTGFRPDLLAGYVAVARKWARDDS